MNRTKLMTPVLGAFFSVGAACDLPAATLAGPTQAVAGPNGYVYVADGYDNARVAVFDPEGVFLFDWGDKGFGRGQFNTVHGLAVAASGDVYVADRGNKRVQVFNDHGDYLKQFTGTKTGRPWGIATGGDDSVWVVDGGDQTEKNSRAGVVELDPDGELLRRFGRAGSGPGELNWAHALAVLDGAVYIADLKNRRLQKFIPGEDCRGGYCTDSQWQVAVDLEEPLAVASTGSSILIGDGGEQPVVYELDPLGGLLAEFELPEHVLRPHGLSVDDEGYIWLADDERDLVFKFDREFNLQLVIGAGQ